jgi:hypothetical protein
VSIFVSIASYRDEEIVKTVRSIYENASRPEDLTICVISQELRNNHPKLDFIPEDQLILVKVHAKDAKGAGYARKLAVEEYRGEDFFFQTDSHMRFAEGWDSKLIDMYHVAVEKQGTDKIILSQFPAPYMPLTDGTDHYVLGDEDFWDEPSWTTVVNTWTGVWAGNREKIEDMSSPHYSHTILAGLLFAPGKVVEEIPYDERISFMGEELCFAIRAFTRGWHIYAPNEMVCWHFYKREERPKIWKDNMAGRSWTDIEMRSQRVQRDVLLGVEQGTFGIGDYQKYLEYQEMIGINFEEFYEKDLSDKVNLGLVTQEIEFDKDFNLVEISKTGYCREGYHSRCFAKEICDCICHNSDKEDIK